MQEDTQTLIIATYFLGRNNILMNICQICLLHIRFNIYKALIKILIFPSSLICQRPLIGPTRSL